ncbi:hypothetical protein C4K25_4909 [Pseudomonas chlororaphis]|nr:hypothetical protein C4K25_4909 [Pseudomonas chlororaphis]
MRQTEAGIVPQPMSKNCQRVQGFQVGAQHWLKTARRS